MPSESSKLSVEEAVAWIREDFQSRYGAALREPVEAGRVRDYLLAMNEPAEIGPGEEVPALFLLTLGRTRRPQPSRGAAVNAGDEFEFYEPVIVGDTITVKRRLLAVDEKKGKVGAMYLSRAEITYTNQRGNTVALARQNTLRWDL